ncbi:MAG: ankyrin repeat domain-containing protein [Cephaloticoccus sp.]|nr:ankyrin repeat domain-containing protein [Cephaloticoccus sp.]MCF7760680.1 ankyrin repeat domain-containing protein [Cephaloticoccus sp.]
MPTRRTFIRSSAALIATGMVGPFSAAQDQPDTAKPTNNNKTPGKPPSLNADLVRETVGQAHRSLEAVRALVEATPLLVNACWDWGGGDFETPLQAAAHTGGRDIAEFLLAHQARQDVYAAAMLGDLNFVQHALAADPVTLATVPGPHGFTLLHCANKGGELARPVYDWLIAQGVPEVLHRPLPYIWPDGTAPGGKG